MQPLIQGHPVYERIHKFGETPDIDSTDTNEEVWDGTGAYPWPSANATTTVVSSSGDDAEAGTGAQRIAVYGISIDSGTGDWVEYREEVTLDGVTPVSLSRDYFRIYRAHTIQVGSGGQNAGNIDVKHGATVLARIRTGLGQTLMAIYTVPDTGWRGFDFSYARVVRWDATIGAVSSARATVALQIRQEGEGWRTRRIANISEGSGYDFDEPIGVIVQPRTDIRLQVLNNGVNNSTIAGGFVVYQARQP